MMVTENKNSPPLSSEEKSTTRTEADKKDEKNNPTTQQPEIPHHKLNNPPIAPRPASMPVTITTTTTTTTQTGKRRAACNRACSACRKAHKACENERPCRRCVARGNGQACSQEAMEMGDYRPPSTERTMRRLAPLLKKRKLDPGVPVVYDPALALLQAQIAFAQTFIPHSAVPFVAPQPAPAMIVAHQTPTQNNSIIAQSSPSEELKVQAKLIILKLLNELRQLNQSTASLKEEQNRLRDELARIRASEGEFQQGLEALLCSPAPVDRAILDFFAQRDVYPQLWERLHPKITDDGYIFEVPLRPMKSRQPEPGSTNLDVAFGFRQFAVDDATRPFIIVRWGGPDTDAPCLAVSDSFCALLGYTREEMLTSGGHYRFIALDREAAVEADKIIGQWLKPHPGVSASETVVMRMKYYCKDDSVLTAMASSQVFYDDKGDPSWIIGCILEIESRSSFIEPLSIDDNDSIEPQTTVQQQPSPTTQNQTLQILPQFSPPQQHTPPRVPSPQYHHPPQPQPQPQLQPTPSPPSIELPRYPYHWQLHRSYEHDTMQTDEVPENSSSGFLLQPLDSQPLPPEISPHPISQHMYNLPSDACIYDGPVQRLPLLNPDPAILPHTHPAPRQPHYFDPSPSLPPQQSHPPQPSSYYGDYAAPQDFVYSDPYTMMQQPLFVNSLQPTHATFSATATTTTTTTTTTTNNNNNNQYYKHPQQMPHQQQQHNRRSGYE